MEYSFTYDELIISYAGCSIVGVNSPLTEVENK
jgi:hypothetical protein